MRFYAHTNQSLGTDHWQLLRDHLRKVEKRAAELAAAARPHDKAFIENARAAGLLHDLGKYRREFQDMLRAAAEGRPARKSPHAVYGALQTGIRAFDLAAAVFGHHAGLPCRLKLRDRMQDPAAQEELKKVLENATGDGLHDIPGGLDTVSGWSKDRLLSFDLRVRMLFSCLVDADRLDTARSQGSPLPDSRPLDAQPLLDGLLEHVRRRAAEVPDGELKRLRGEMLQACLDAASLDGRLFSLPMPTGGGKTFASMAFALKRAALLPDDIRRIVVVIPFLSIIEQNAAAYAEALGPENILEHHSGDLAGLKLLDHKGAPSFAPVEPDESDPRGPQYRLATENWDAPVVVTTSVRFFDSLFSNRPRDLRRMHNLARSLVIVDEVQTLPPGLIKPLQSMMKGLADEWGTQFLFCTATQPAFERLEGTEVDAKLSEDPRWDPGTVRSLLPEELTSRAYRRLARVRDPVWPAAGETIEPQDLAERLAERPKVLCVVNTKSQAAEIFKLLQERADGGAFHLSTRMCAQHRLDSLERIRALARKDGAVCRVVSTQLVEAGVDLDFPAVLRAMAPLDAMIQAAGRCDREGALSEKAGAPAGELAVFRLDARNTPYGAALDQTESLINGRNVSLHEPDHVLAYFHRLYLQKDKDSKDIDAFRANLDFPKVAEEFGLIRDATRSVLAPYGDGRELIQQASSAFTVDQKLLRALQRYQVGLYPHEWAEAKRLGAIYQLGNDLDLWACMPSCYDPEMGLVVRAPDPAEFVC